MAVKQRIMFAHEGGKLSYADRCLEQALTYIRRLLQKLVVSHRLGLGLVKLISLTPLLYQSISLSLSGRQEEVDR